MEQQTCRRLVDKVAIVTGGGQWIGRAIALRLASEGADVAVDDIVAERANTVADEIRGLGCKALALAVDVTKSEEAEAMVKAVLDEFGKIDILVNNVGGGGRVASEKSPFFWDSTEEGWDTTIARSLKSTRNCTRAVINHMKERKSGKIINISSGAGIRGIPGSVAYSAAKAGVIGFTMALSQEMAEHGVRVNCVAPGPTGAPGPQPPEFADRMAKLSGLGRQGKPEDVAGLVAFLASESDFISGQTYAEGGMNP